MSDDEHDDDEKLNKAERLAIAAYVAPRARSKGEVKRSRPVGLLGKDGSVTGYMALADVAPGLARKKGIEIQTVDGVRPKEAVCAANACIFRVPDKGGIPKICDRCFEREARLRKKRRSMAPRRAPMPFRDLRDRVAAHDRDELSFRDMVRMARDIAERVAPKVQELVDEGSLFPMAGKGRAGPMFRINREVLRGGVQERILRAVQKHEGATSLNQIAEYVGGRRSAILKLLADMIAAGTICKDGERWVSGRITHGSTPPVIPSVA